MTCRSNPVSLAEVLHASPLRFLHLPICMDHLSCAVKIQTRVPTDRATLQPWEGNTWMQPTDSRRVGMLRPTLTLLSWKPLCLWTGWSLLPHGATMGAGVLLRFSHLSVFTPAADLSTASGKSSPAHGLEVWYLTPARVCLFWLSTAPLMSWSCSINICYIDHWRKVL